MQSVRQNLYSVDSWHMLAVFHQKLSPQHIEDVSDKVPESDICMHEKIVHKIRHMPRAACFQ